MRVNEVFSKTKTTYVSRNARLQLGAMEQRVAPLDMDEGPLRKWARSELKLARWPMVPQDFEREVSDIHPMMQHLENAIAFAM
jgi:hypothetical protein